MKNWGVFFIILAVLAISVTSDSVDVVYPSSGGTILTGNVSAIDWNTVSCERNANPIGTGYKCAFGNGGARDAEAYIQLFNTTIRAFGISCDGAASSTAEQTIHVNGNPIGCGLNFTGNSATMDYCNYDIAVGDVVTAYSIADGGAGWCVWTIGFGRSYNVTGVINATGGGANYTFISPWLYTDTLGNVYWNETHGNITYNTAGPTINTSFWTLYNYTVCSASPCYYTVNPGDRVEVFGRITEYGSTINRYLQLSINGTVVDQLENDQGGVNNWAHFVLHHYYTADKTQYVATTDSSIASTVTDQSFWINVYKNKTIEGGGSGGGSSTIVSQPHHIVFQSGHTKGGPSLPGACNGFSASTSLGIFSDSGNYYGNWNIGRRINITNMSTSLKVVQGNYTGTLKQGAYFELLIIVNSTPAMNTTYWKGYYDDYQWVDNTRYTFLNTSFRQEFGREDRLGLYFFIHKENSESNKDMCWTSETTNAVATYV